MSTKGWTWDEHDQLKAMVKDPAMGDVSGALRIAKDDAFASLGGKPAKWDTDGKSHAARTISMMSDPATNCTRGLQQTNARIVANREHYMESNAGVYGATFNAKPTTSTDMWGCSGCGTRIRCWDGMWCHTCLDKRERYKTDPTVFDSQRREGIYAPTPAPVSAATEVKYYCNRCKRNNLSYRGAPRPTGCLQPCAHCHLKVEQGFANHMS